MVITSKSLQRSNIAFVFKKEGFIEPENSVFAGLYTGELAKGARFMDDPTMKLKVYHLPKSKTTFTLEGTRFRVDHDTEDGNMNTGVVSDGLSVYKNLFSGCGLESYGFNFDIIYRFDNTLQLDYLFGRIVDNGRILEKRDLTALGVQFTLQRPNNRSETYFLKIVSPLELAAHINYHLNSDRLPEDAQLKGLFEKSYSEVDEIIKNLKF